MNTILAAPTIGPALAATLDTEPAATGAAPAIAVSTDPSPTAPALTHAPSPTTWPRKRLRPGTLATIAALHVGLALLFAHASRPTVAPKPLPVRLLADFIEAPKPVEPPPPLRVEVQPKQPKPEPRRELPQPPQPDPPVTSETMAPSFVPAAPMPSPLVLHTSPAPPAPAPAPAPPPAPRIELPSSDADYLQNPKPVYPALSKRLNEQGTVIIRVLIGTDGLPQQAQIAKSSGYERLDQAALSTVQKWRFVPGKRAGVPEAMWFNVPISFVLE